MSFSRVCAAICLLTFAATPAFADPATDAMGKAEALYRKGSLGKAYDQVEAAATLVARKLSAQYAKSFPPAPGGWRALPPLYSTKGRIRVGRGLVLWQHYVQNGGPGRATAQINIDQADLIDTAKVNLVPNERHAKAARRDLVPIKGAGNGFLKFSSFRGVGNVYIFVADRFYITVSARNIKNRAFLTKLLSTWDFAGLKKTAGAQ